MSIFNKLGNHYGKIQIRYNLAKEYKQKLLEMNLRLFQGDHLSIAGSYNNLGLVYLKLNNIKEAIFNFNKVLALKFDHKEANFNLGLTYEKLRKFDQAEIFFNFAIKFDKNFSKAYVHLARILFQKCEFGECLFLVKRGLVIFQEPEFYEILGDLEMLKGNFLGLLENYNKSLSIT